MRKKLLLTSERLSDLLSVAQSWSLNSGQPDSKGHLSHLYLLHAAPLSSVPKLLSEIPRLLQGHCHTGLSILSSLSSPCLLLISQQRYWVCFHCLMTHDSATHLMPTMASGSGWSRYLRANSPNPSGASESWGCPKRALPNFSKPPPLSITSPILPPPPHLASPEVQAECSGRESVACGSADLGSGSAQPLPINCCGTLDKVSPLWASVSSYI